MASGSLRGVEIDGISFNVSGDSNFSIQARVEKENMPHSSGNLVKETLTPASGEGVKIIATPSEYELLLAAAASVTPITIGVTLRDGSVFRTNGGVSIGAYTSEDFACEVTLFTQPGEWSIFSET